MVVTLSTLANVLMAEPVQFSSVLHRVVELDTAVLYEGTHKKNMYNQLVCVSV